MRIKFIPLALALGMVSVSSPIWTQPAQQAQAHPAIVLAEQLPPRTLSVSGQVTSIGPTSLVVEIKNGEDPRAMDFVIDDNTKVTGKLATGSIADVQYRVEKDKDIAVNITIESGQ